MRRKARKYILGENGSKIDFEMSFIVVGYFVAMMFYTVSKRVINAGGVISIALAVLAFSFIFWRIFKNNKVFLNDPIFAFGIVIFGTLYLLSFLRGVPTKIIVQYVMRFALGLILFIAVRHIKDYSVLHRAFRVGSHLIFFFALPIMLVDRGNVRYAMNFSYILMISFCFILLDCYQLKKYKFRSFLVCAIEFFLIVSFGARGALLCALIAILFFAFFIDKSGFRKFFLISFILVYLILFSQLSSLLFGLLESLNISSRTIALLQSGGIHLSGREEIYADVISNIALKPFIGWGLAGEYKFQAEYCHNLFLEILLDFGLFAGLALIVLILYILISGFKRTDSNLKGFYICLLIYGFITLMVSESYLTHDGFYVIMGISSSIVFGKKGLTNNTIRNKPDSNTLIASQNPAYGGN